MSEAHQPALHKNSGEVTAAAKRLLRFHPLERIELSDPRLAPVLQPLGLAGIDLRSAVAQMADASHCHISPVLLAKRLGELHDRIRQLSRMTLEEELEDLLSLVSNARNREMVLKHLGWDGQGGRTLDAVGADYRLTRERVRQICERSVHLLKGRRVYLPVLDRALQFIGDCLPAPAEEVETRLATAGISDAPFRLEGIGRAAQLLGRKPPFIIETARGRLFAAAPTSAGLATAIIQAARKSVSHWGVTTVEDVSAQVQQGKAATIDSRFVSKVLVAQADFQWLDVNSGWFWLTSAGRNSLLNQIEKVLSVAGRIAASDLRGGVSRPHRREGFAPPQRVLLSLCRQVPGYRVEENSIIADPPKNWEEVLSETERTMVSVLHAKGPVMERQQFEDLCLSRGLKRDTFFACLSYSPVLQRFAQSVDGLRGANVPPGLVDSLAARRQKSKVLQDYGWTEDGRINITYRLSKSIVSNGVVTIPSRLSQFLQGRFAIETVDGSAVGTLVVKETSA